MAIVTNDDLVYGMMRIYEAMSDEEFHIRVYRTKEEAETWLYRS